MAQRSRSLLELKQKQWAREREETLINTGIWHRFSDAAEHRHRPRIRSTSSRSTASVVSLDSQSTLPIRRRTPSLPPIPSQAYESPHDENGGGNTSGYASDSADFVNNENQWKLTNWPQCGYGLGRTPESFSSGSGGREERAKWGDKGVGVGHLWTPNEHAPGTHLPLIEHTTPSWIQRGLQEPSQVLFISHDESLPASLANSRDMSRSTDTIPSSEDSQRCFLRGQNIPVDPFVAAEKERKRLKALEHQNAIMQQLEEKEKKKKDDEERRKIEERLDEERLRKHHELERQRLEEEKRRQEEKEEKDQRVAQALREAIKIAEKKALEEKARARRKHVSAQRSNSKPDLTFSESRETVGDKKGFPLDNVYSQAVESLVPQANSNEILVYHSQVLLEDPASSRNSEANRASAQVSSAINKNNAPRQQALNLPKSPRILSTPENSPPINNRSPKLHEVIVESRSKPTSPAPQLVMEPSTSQSPVPLKKDPDPSELKIPSRYNRSTQSSPQHFNADNAIKKSSEIEKVEEEPPPYTPSFQRKPQSVTVDRGASPLITSDTMSFPSSSRPTPQEFPHKQNEFLFADDAALKSELKDPPEFFDDIFTVALPDVLLQEEEVDTNRLCLVHTPSPARLLTPTSVRGGPLKAEVATQTDFRVSRPTRRVQRLEDRPKWGVNKPSTRFIKASDRYPLSRPRSNDSDDSRSPSPLHRTKPSYSNHKNHSMSVSKPPKESKAINTPRVVHILPKPAIFKKAAMERRYSGSRRASITRAQGSLLPKKFDLTELLTVKDVLSQLTSLKHGLKMKQKEWTVSRSPTPFSEVQAVE